MRPDPRELAAVFAGGAIGSAARAGLADAWAASPGRWPWATFAVNLIGAFLLGLLAARLWTHRPPSSYRRSLLGAGFCGGLTTFSTMQVELLRMLDHDRVGLALAYSLSSIGMGYLAVASAARLARPRALRP
jgi:CrcB protein